MQKKLTVSQLNNYISGVFEDEYVLHDITVEGEISELSGAGGRTFLTLKEDDYCISCVCFTRVADIPAGTLVEALGSVSFYKKTGRISFIIKELAPKGEGQQYLELLRLKEKLRADGLFENKLPLPGKINKIAVVTSETGAVLHDIISVITAKNILINIAVYDVRVQGKSSSVDIAEAVRRLNADPHGADVIIVARGGGSAADLLSYNTEGVARAVAASRIPVVSAVGHETDYTLCDLCASVRAGTPSIAADLVTSPLSARTDRLMQLIKGMQNTLSEKYISAVRRINYNTVRLTGRAELVVQRRRERVAGSLRSMHNSLSGKFAAGSEKVGNLAAVLDRLSPLKVLSRGYAKITLGNKEVSSAAVLKAGDEVNILFKDGKKAAEIK